MGQIGGRDENGFTKSHRRFGKYQKTGAICLRITPVKKERED
jgi:hypothetical protein